MKVFIYGAGRLGQITYEAFRKRPGLFSDVALYSPRRTSSQRREGVPDRLEFDSGDPDILVMSASAVPRTTRRFLAKTFAPIARFWDAERHYNLRLFQRLLPLLAKTRWKVLIVQTNPVHEWVNAFQTLFPERLVLGFGTAFDDRRIRYLSAAMSPCEDPRVLRKIRVIGGHGAAMVLDRGSTRDGVVETAQWMSDSLSIMFINAPDKYAENWWVSVGLEPLVQGLAGHRTRSHLIVPLEYQGIRAATGIEAVIKGLKIRPILPPLLSAEARTQFQGHLMQMREAGFGLAKLIENKATKLCSDPREKC